MHQVRNNLESQRRQYGLDERARDLGFTEVHVIDEDLGRSGSGVQDRPGFARLLAVVCEARVGAVLAIEASRLARNNREWHHLVDLCSLTETLVIDHDGVYDPRLLNDRLLLGLKGTMSEFELGLFRQRAHEALRQMTARGEVFKQVPVGYLRTDERGCEMIADRQVQEAIRGVFAKFREVGSARQVYLWYLHEDLPLPSLKPLAKEILWEIPTYARVQAMLRNPIYAGAFVSGRRSKTTVLVDGQTRRKIGRMIPMNEWPVLIPDHHPGYISWNEFLRNQDLLRKNSGRSGWMSGGAPKLGPALLTGLLRCRRCGRSLCVVYCGNKGKRIPRYHCRTNDTRSGPEKCISFSGLRLEQDVMSLVLEALAPIAVEASLAAEKRLEATNDEKRRALTLAVERASYEVDHARRQYDAVDPANRLVASELEKRWNNSMERLHDAEARLEEASGSNPGLTELERHRLLEIGRDVEALWNHPAASKLLKKRILRTVFNEIVVDISDEPREVLVWLHWTGGVITHQRFRRSRIGDHRCTTDRSIVEIVTELSKICDDSDIARALNRLALKTGKGNAWTSALVRSLRSKRDIPVFRRGAAKTWLTQQETMKELGISFRTFTRIVRAGILPARQVIPHTPWVIEPTALTLPGVRAAVAAARARRELPLNHVAQGELPLQ
jgi:DNA invertase Pin-like site-specific DNA recombinase